MTPNITKPNRNITDKILDKSDSKPKKIPKETQIICGILMVNITPTIKT